MRKEDYQDKLINLINDQAKLIKLSKDPSNNLKYDINKIFTRKNRETNSNLTKISGH